MNAMWISCRSSMMRVAKRRDDVVLESWVRARSRACTSMCEPMTCCEVPGSSIGSKISVST
jgi:hypothetical protein